MKSSVCAIGLGNLLLQDDAVGLHAIETIKERYRFRAPIDLFDGGTAGLDLLPLIEQYEKVLFVDAVDAGQPAGTIVIVEGEEIPSFLTSQVSVHHVGLSDLLFAARMAGCLPAEICLIGVQPESVDIGLEMTDVLKESLDLLLTTVVKRLQKWGVEPV
jgi:hydrogenase maturation protease